MKLLWVIMLSKYLNAASVTAQERCSVKHERAHSTRKLLHYRESASFKTQKECETLRIMTDTKAWVNTLCSLLLHSCLHTVV